MILGQGAEAVLGEQLFAELFERGGERRRFVVGVADERPAVQEVLAELLAFGGREAQRLVAGDVDGRAVVKLIERERQVDGLPGLSEQAAGPSAGPMREVRQV